MFNRNKSIDNARVFYKYHYYYVLVLQNTSKTSEDHLTLILSYKVLKVQIYNL